MASRKYNKKRRTQRLKKYKGGSYINPATYDSSTANPYITYDVNTFEIDPSRTILSARNIVGGKENKRNKKGKQTRKNKGKKIRGGSTTSLAPQFNNPISSFGTVLGASASSAILNGTQLTTSAPYIQPINTPYGNHNPALI